VEFPEILRNAVKCTVNVDEPMEKHVTFRAGGKAAYYAEPTSLDELRAVVDCANDCGIEWRVIGNGSNILVRDEGYKGLIIALGRRFGAVGVSSGDTVFAEAGALLSRVGSIAADAGLAGFEFAAGIPGSVGGAVAMNAGAFGGEMSDIVTDVAVLTRTGAYVERAADRLGFGYRTSDLQRNGDVVVAARFKLEKGDPAAIREQMAQLARTRRSRQPLELPSAGSAFKRPEGTFAAKLIDEAGLKGLSVGGARVSEKHAGFIVNAGGATASDIIALMDEVKRRVKESSGIELEPEIKVF
jgi:UDP-N-acetylmuramate dehydrogenase